MALNTICIRTLSNFFCLAFHSLLIHLPAINTRLHTTATKTRPLLCSKLFSGSLFYSSPWSLPLPFDIMQASKDNCPASEPPAIPLAILPYIHIPHPISSGPQESCLMLQFLSTPRRDSTWPIIYSLYYLPTSWLTFVSPTRIQLK